MESSIDWEVHFICDDPDEFGWIPVSFGALGVEILSGDTIRAFFTGDENAKATFVENCEQEGLKFTAAAELEKKNWVQECQELMEPLEAGALRVVPVVDASRVPESRDVNDLYLIPGSGFGTGHHVTTGMALLLLQQPCVLKLAPRRIFDLGTGSGILAVATAMLFDARVDAVDIEEAALINGADNADINGQSASIRFRLGSVEHMREKYDLVVANLYAELLCRFVPEISEHTKAGGMFLVSGIMATLWQDVERSYALPNWKLIERREELDWCAALFERI